MTPQGVFPGAGQCFTTLCHSTVYLNLSLVNVVAAGAAPQTPLTWQWFPHARKNVLLSLVFFHRPWPRALGLRWLRTLSPFVLGSVGGLIELIFLGPQCTRPSRTNIQKRCPFHYRGLDAKVGSQETPGVTGKLGLGVQNEAGKRLIEFCQENALVTANTLFQQHKRRLYTWTSPDGQHWNQIDYILCSQRWRSSIQSAKTRPGADCGWDQEHIAKFRKF